MPARVVRAEINSSDSLSRVSMPADLTFRALIVACDDYGRIDGRVPVLRGVLFPIRREVTDAKLDSWLDELAAGPDAPILRYESGGRPFIALTGWEKHRGKGRRGGASKCPPPLPRSSEETHALPSEGREARDEGRGTRSEGRGTRAPEAQAPAASRPALVAPAREVVFPGSMTSADWEDLAAKHGVDAGALYTIAASWGGEKNRRYKPTGWKLAIDRALRDRWSWTTSLFSTPSAERESAAQAKERRLDEAAREAFRRLANPDESQPTLLALDGGRS